MASQLRSTYFLSRKFFRFAFLNKCWFIIFNVRLSICTGNYVRIWIISVSLFPALYLRVDRSSILIRIMADSLLDLRHREPKLWRRTLPKDHFPMMALGAAEVGDPREFYSMKRPGLCSSAFAEVLHVASLWY